MPEERKLVTVLFADIVGSTAMGLDHDPEVMRAALGRAFEMASERAPIDTSPSAAVEMPTRKRAESGSRGPGPAVGHTAAVSEDTMRPYRPTDGPPVVKGCSGSRTTDVARIDGPTRVISPCGGAEVGRDQAVTGCLRLSDCRGPSRPG